MRQDEFSAEDRISNTAVAFYMLIHSYFGMLLRLVMSYNIQIGGIDTCKHYVHCIAIKRKYLWRQGEYHESQ
jgi:hypothetical protein